ncbi:MAG: hypothetical protein A2806_03215 [Candidatus Terrybacteria bacterium RIFCSPHIGHO2_01_FULL_48_17]|uniref:Uncharacterized protein n=1 Tax=Candidatus Terrybacteria bacterium RIFCSPHIGHO2_01_FULL_48_17 TaxID=1802362 RepID=A0A1G2PIY2_9BACT|nr:MAG: hypothetical protein A2806_03215 [Candidatus Terrybacteria bacterium RIFCSPHIGHO2_01_FULL_48_17]OHA53228.1 MAG: hypothetical protein A3A30_04395 [Candidatus Terrybacteria bacterium RIFCSPLOWO2_01_FULL_48_14]
MTSQKKQIVSVAILLAILVLVGLIAAWLVTRTKSSETPEVFYPEGYVPPQPGQFLGGQSLEENIAEINERPAVRIISMPQSVPAGQRFQLTFLVSVPPPQQPAQTSLVSVHYGGASLGYIASAGLSDESYPQKSFVLEGEEVALPRTFFAFIEAPVDMAGASLYMRARVIIEKETFWSNEVAVLVGEPSGDSAASSPAPELDEETLQQFPRFEPAPPPPAELKNF